MCLHPELIPPVPEVHVKLIQVVTNPTRLQNAA